MSDSIGVNHMKQIVLNAPDKAALWEALHAAGFAAESEYGPLVTEGSFVEVGTVHAPTGNMLTEDGFEFEETAPVDGWFAVLMTDRDTSALSELIVTDAPASVPRFAVPEPTPAEIEAKARARADAIKSECSARILAVADERTQGNIAQAGILYLAMRGDGRTEDEAHAAVGLKEGDMATATAFRQWVAAMQAHCRALIVETATDDWPAVPAGRARA